MSERCFAQATMNGRLERCVFDGGHKTPCSFIVGHESHGNAQVGAVKKDAGKNRLDLISELAIEGLGQVLTFGAQKYEADNWRKGLAWRRCIGAAQRHLLAFSRGEDVDAESGLPHVDHAMCCLMFLSEFQKLKCGTDDRWKPRPPEMGREP